MEDGSSIKWRLKYLKLLNFPIGENIDPLDLLEFFGHHVPDAVIQTIIDAPNLTTRQCVSLENYAV